MRVLQSFASAAIVAAGLLVACSDGEGGLGGGGAPKADEDERGSVGVPPTAAEYCVKLGFRLENGTCFFPDGTSCDQWSFYRGECGGPHSYCNQHGGSISSLTVDKGSYTAVFGVCTVNGKQCTEGSFIESGKCEVLGL